MMAAELPSKQKEEEGIDKKGRERAKKKKMSSLASFPRTPTQDSHSYLIGQIYLMSTPRGKTNLWEAEHLKEGTVTSSTKSEFRKEEVGQAISRLP